MKEENKKKLSYIFFSLIFIKHNIKYKKETMNRSVTHFFSFYYSGRNFNVEGKV